jgi:FtsP/CotA-like multicopper oxidase with cupredoxin domain
MVKLNRRQFIALGTAATGVVFVSNCLRKGSIVSQPLLSSSSVPLSNLYQSSNGLLELNLEAKESLVNLGNRQAYLLTYNGQIPAPRLEAKPGDKVRIHFTNSLSNL